MLRKLLTLLSLCFLTATYGFAQTGTITGTVTDAETGEPIPTVNVYLPEIQQGAATGLNGTYTIEDVPVGTHTLRVSFVGYTTYNQQIQVESGENVIDIQLEIASVGLDQLVVTGYGAIQPELEQTGAIASITAENVEDVPAQNAIGLLQGRAAGVSITSTSGTPGGAFDIQIRGRGSINAGTDPLIIVDGVQISSSGIGEGNNSVNPLNFIDPASIESMQVLKGPAAASIYGAQAGNGVILITTKQGSQETRVSFSIERGVSQRIKNVDYWNTEQLVEYRIASIAYDNGLPTTMQGLNDAGMYDAVLNNYRDGYLTNSDGSFSYGFDPSVPISEYPNTNWYDFVSRSGISQKYRMSVSGGSDLTRWRISGSYKDLDGYIKQNNYQNYRLAGRFNQKLSEKFSLSLDINLSRQKFAGPCQDGFYINCPISAASFTLPITRPYLDDGSYSPYFPFIGVSSNPAIQFNERDRLTNLLYVMGSLQLQYNVTDWLSVKGTAAMDYHQETNKQWRSPTISPGNGGSVSRSINPVTNQQYSVVANFRHTFNEKHELSGLAGIEYRRNYEDAFGTVGEGLPNNTFDVLSATATPTSAFGSWIVYKRMSYFGKATYAYDKRFVLSGTLRYDGDSRFGEEVRYGLFPAISGAWVISNEDFYNVGFMNYLKIRAEYGVTGNSELNDYYAARSLFGVASTYASLTGLAPTQLANPQLTWEEAHSIGIGLDFGFFNNRINGTVNIYRETTSDLLLGRPLPVSSGWGEITENIGEVQNQGIEFQVNTINVRAGDFQWSTSFNISYNENEVTELSGGNEALYPDDVQPVAIGHDIDAWKIYRWAGVNPADGRPMWYDKNGNITYNPQTDEDRVYVGFSSQPIVGGFGNTFTYKGLSLDIFFQFMFGQEAIPQQVMVWGVNQVGGSGTNGIERRLTKAWREPGDVAQYPAPTQLFNYQGTAGFFTTASDKLSDADYIRLKNVRLAYSLPSSITKQVGLRNITIYASGLNLITWTSWMGYDPETASDFTQSSIPNSRIINGGISVEF